jgi:replication factor A1
MRNVSVAGRVFKRSDVIEFKKKDGSEGRVVNIFVGDKTGFVRVPLWNEHVNLVEDDIIKLGDIVQISGAYAQENIYGDVEISLGKYGEIFDVTAEAEGSDIEFPSAEEMSKNFLKVDDNRMSISEVKPGKAKIKGTVIDVIKSGFIFNVCPKCGKKATEESGKFICESHGEITPDPKMYISFMVDDGTGILRSVAFRDVAESISGVSSNDLSKDSVDERYQKVSGNVVGKEYILDGNVKRNTRYDRFEIVVNKAEPINISEESEKLKSLLNMKLS